VELIFFGTSSGTPTKTRNVSGVAVKKVNSKLWCLIDCGEGTQHQILRTKLALNKLQMILITHIHGDHCYGLPGLLASATMSDRTEPLTIVGPSQIKEFIEVTQTATQLRLSYAINFICIEDSLGVITGSEFNINVVELSHRVPSYAFVFSEKDISSRLDIAKLNNDGIESGPNWGKIQKGLDVTLADGRLICASDYLLSAREPRKIVVSGDNDTPDLLSETAGSVDVLVHEATYTEDVAEKVGKGPQHSTAKMVCKFAEGAGIKNLVLTHFSPRYQEENDGGPCIADVECEARKNYSGNLFLARDLDRYQLNKEGRLTLL